MAKEKIYVSLPISGLDINEVKLQALKTKEVVESLGYEALTPFDIEPSEVRPTLSTWVGV